MTWGYALGWPPIFLSRHSDPLLAKLMLLVEFELQTTGVPLDHWAQMTPERRDLVCQFLEDHGLSLTLGIHAKWSEDSEALKARTDQLIAWLEEFGSLAKAPICTTSGEGHHRFAAHPTLESQLEALSVGLAPLAAACRDLGMPLAIENHGDYYVSDLVDLCERAPGLGIFLDTGNCCLVGEKPLDAAREAAPYTLGSHFKDQLLAPRPTASPLCFEVGNAIPGKGSLPLREIFQVIWEGCPDRDRLAMQIEMFPSPWDGEPALDQLREASEFVRSLGGSE